MIIQHSAEHSTRQSSATAQSLTKSSTTQSINKSSIDQSTNMNQSRAESERITESSMTRSTATTEIQPISERSITQSTTTIQSITECQSTFASSITQSTAESSTSQSVDYKTGNSMLAGSAKVTSLPSKLIIDYFDAKYQMVDGAMLLKRAKEIFVNMEVNDSESKLIEQCTKEQRKSDQWFLYHCGRITASSFHVCLKTSHRHPKTYK